MGLRLQPGQQACFFKGPPLKYVINCHILAKAPLPLWVMTYYKYVQPLMSTYLLKLTIYCITMERIDIDDITL